MHRRTISSGSDYEKTIGYSRAVVAGGWIHVAGTTGTDHATMTVPPSVTDQCALALSHIDAALKTAGASFDDVVRVNYILPDRADFEPCWPQLRAAFSKAAPAATMIEAGLLDPAMKIEIEVTAFRPDAA